jgi:DNA-directed RNA polymerase subunit RPC12/RpoP
MTKPGAFSTETRLTIYARQEGRCAYCGMKTERGQYHHRLPRRMGGSKDNRLDIPANGVYICGGCHRRIESDRVWAYQRGWLLRATEHPEEVPVKLWDGWALLKDHRVVPTRDPGVRDPQEAADAIAERLGGTLTEPPSGPPSP